MVVKQMVYGVHEVDTVVALLVEQLRSCPIMTFSGPLGAGKTTLIRGILKVCGVHGSITSPTFTYVSSYTNGQGQTFYHFDLYRIRNLNDFLAAGFDEYLDVPNSYALIEWPEIVKPLLAQHSCHVILDYHEDKRIVRIEKNNAG